MLIATSTLFSKFINIKLFLSTKVGGANTPPFYFNMSFNVGDDKERVKQNRKLFFNSIKIDENNIAFQKQTHSNNVLIINKPGIYNNCDGLLTNKKNVFLSVSVADCVPIFLYDSENEVVGTVHSGWQGSEKKILSKAIKLLKSNFNTKPENIYSFIGFSAGVCCYEIGIEVANKFEEKFLRFNNNKIFLDLKKFNYSLLLNENIPENNIEVCSLCTICNSNILHSYRRDGQHSGRMIGIIGMI